MKDNEIAGVVGEWAFARYKLLGAINDLFLCRSFRRPLVRLYLPKNGFAVFGAQDNVGEEE